MYSNPYNEQIVIQTCAICGDDYLGHPSSRYCSESCRNKGHRNNQKKNRAHVHTFAEQYRATLINPSPEQFLLTTEIHSKSHNPKPTRIYALSSVLASLNLPSNVDLYYFPPDGLANKEGVPYWVMMTEAASPEVSQAPKQINALDILDKHLKSD